MAERVTEITLGVDASKETLDFYHWEDEQSARCANDRGEIETYLGAFHGPVRLAVEATSTYHLTVVEVALELGYTVYLVNPRQLVHYREAVNVRNKTDALDAWLLARYLDREAASLRPFKPQDKRAQELWTLLKRRAVVVNARQQLELSFREIRLSSQALFTQFKHVLARIDQRLRTLVRALGWEADCRRCRSIPGVGPLNAIALVATYHRGAFAGSDAFISFIGFDVRVRESGRFKGQRKITKRGEAELRRLLYCAAQPARSNPRFDRYYQQQIDKGFSKIAAKVALARKIARIAFTLLHRQESFKIKEVTA